MAKVQNQEIGVITCPISGKRGSVRKNRNGKLYYLSEAGMITPNYREGQEWMLENAKLHGPEGPKIDPVNESSPVNGNPPKKSWFASLLEDDETA